MAFLLYRKEYRNNELFYINTGEGYKLAGSGLIYKAWIKRGKPINKGWSIVAEDLLSNYRDDFDAANHILLVDFHPDSKQRIGIIEIEKIHIYNYGDESNGSVHWSPIMLEMCDVFYREYYDNPLSDEKEGIISEIMMHLVEKKKSVEFLYLLDNWNWGRNGSTNAAFIQPGAREYFRNFF
ncbi:MAG: hypothetical protein JSU01_03745 [Bacteroidetes bacterium]|nr:hypothetical protein [Bacteroidota bacterium]